MRVFPSRHSTESSRPSNWPVQATEIPEEPKLSIAIRSAFAVLTSPAAAPSTMEAATPTAETRRGRRAHELKNLFMRESPLVDRQRVERERKTAQTGMEQRRANGRHSGPHGPSGDRPRSPAYLRKYMHIPCQIRKSARIGKFAHESGRRTREVERIASGGGANRSTRQPAHDLKQE